MFSDVITQFPKREAESLDDYVDALEKAIIRAMLEKAKRNRTQAAKRLGITFRAIRYRMERLRVKEN